MGSKNDKIIRLTAKKFDKLRAKKLPTGITCKLLTKNARTTGYNEIFTVAHWWYKYNSYRELTEIHVATQDTSFASALMAASDIKVGDVVYEIDKRDLSQPDGNRPYWLISAILDPEAR